MPGTITPIKIQRLSYKDWMSGVVTAFQDGRTPINGLSASGNVILDQDGTVRPRPSLVRYGTQPTGTVLGEIYEFVQQGTTYNTNWLICMQNVSGTTQPYISKDGGAWQACSGKTYNNTAAAHFCEVDNKVLITNGQDNLSFLDITTAGTTNAITAFTTLPPPTGPTAVATGFGGTTLTYYYKVTANSTFGETASTASVTVTVDTQRDAWSSTKYITFSWTAPAGATASTTYNVYMGTASGQELLVAQGLNGTTYKDTGVDPVNVTRSAPAFDSTAGPAVTRATVINGQVFMTGDKNNPRYVWYGGTGVNVLNFSPLSGGGWTEIGRGTKEFPVRVMPFRDHAGNPVTTVLCQGTNGKGKRYTMSPSSLTVGSIVVNYFTVLEDNGQAGTDSPDGVILYNDNLWYPSRDGFKTTGTKPQLQNVLSTDTVSETILQDVINLNTAYMNKCVGLGWQNRLYWLLPNGTTTNNEMWVLDLQRGGAWMKPWNIAGDWMVLYNSNNPSNGGDGATHFLVLKNNIIYEMTYSAATADDGVGFTTNLTSGILKFSPDGMEWAHLLNVTFILLRPQGTVNLQVTGRTEDSQIAPLGSSSVIPTATVAGWGEAGWGGSPTASLPLLPEIFGWSHFSVVPVVIGTSRYPIQIDVDEDVNYFQWQLYSTVSGTDYQLSDVIAQYVLIGVKDTVNN